MTTAPSFESLSPALQRSLNANLVRAVNALNVPMVERLLGLGLSATLVQQLPAVPPDGDPSTQTLMDVAWWAGMRRSRPEGLAFDDAPESFPTDEVEAMVRTLVEHGGDPNACEWHVWMNSPSLYLTFVKAGVELNGDENGRLDYHHPMVWWYTQFHRPIDPVVLDTMLEHGLDVHKEVHGHPLLVHCLGACDTVAAERLVQAGAHARSFTLPIDRIVGEHLPIDHQTRQRVDHPEARAAKARTLAWWVAHEQALLREAMNDDAPIPVTATPGARPRL